MAITTDPHFIQVNGDSLTLHLFTGFPSFKQLPRRGQSGDEAKSESETARKTKEHWPAWRTLSFIYKNRLVIHLQTYQELNKKALVSCAFKYKQRITEVIRNYMCTCVQGNVWF